MTASMQVLEHKTGPCFSIERNCMYIFLYTCLLWGTVPTFMNGVTPDSEAFSFGADLSAPDSDASSLSFNDILLSHFYETPDLHDVAGEVGTSAPLPKPFQSPSIG